MSAWIDKINIIFNTAWDRINAVGIKLVNFLKRNLFSNKMEIILFFFFFTFILLIISNDQETIIFNEWMVTFAKLYIHSLNMIFNGIKNFIKECLNIYLDMKSLKQQGEYLSAENERLRIEIDKLRNKINFLESIIYRTKKFNLISNLLHLLDVSRKYYFSKNNTIQQNSILNSLDSIISNLDFISRFFAGQNSSSSSNEEEPKHM